MSRPNTMLAREAKEYYDKGFEKGMEIGFEIGIILGKLQGIELVKLRNSKIQQNIFQNLKAKGFTEEEIRELLKDSEITKT